MLVVDRDPVARRNLQRILRAVGHQVETFTSAAAVKSFKDVVSPRCAIVDMFLPQVTTSQLKAMLTGVCPGLPIIFVSRKGDIPSSVAAMKAGATDFLIKPFEETALLEAIDRALAQDRLALPDRLHVSDLRNRLSTLSRRQRQVFESVVSGMLNKQIAAQFGMSEKTVKFHRANVMKKMRAQSVAQLVKISLKLSSAAEPVPLPEVLPPSAAPRTENRNQVRP